MIEIADVYKSFGNNQVLNGVNLKIEKGETIVVLGRSGCGKSVLLKHIIGLMRPDAGKIFINGEDITAYSDEKLYNLRRRFGMLFQGSALFDSMTVEENVGLALTEHTNLGIEKIKEIVKEKLRLVGMAGVENLKPAELSGGMKKEWVWRGRLPWTRSLCCMTSPPRVLTRSWQT